MFYACVLLLSSERFPHPRRQDNPMDGADLILWRGVRALCTTITASVDIQATHRYIVGSLQHSLLLYFFTHAVFFQTLCPFQTEKESDLIISPCFTHFIDSHGSGSFLSESLCNLEEFVGQVQGSYMLTCFVFSLFYFKRNLKSTFPSESLVHFRLCSTIAPEKSAIHYAAPCLLHESSWSAHDVFVSPRRGWTTSGPSTARIPVFQPRCDTGCRDSVNMFFHM